MPDATFTDNPYSPPSAPVSDAPDSQALTASPYFHVAIWKLILMSISTVGIYLLYWHYRHWKAIKQDQDEKLWPIPRAIFYPLTGFDLYPRFHRSALGVGITPSWGPVAISIAIFILNLLNQVSSWFDVPLLSYAALLQVIPTAMVQSTVNGYLESTHPDVQRNSRLSVWNILWFVLIVVVFALSVFGKSVKA